MSSVWVGRTGCPVCGHPGERDTRVANLQKQMQVRTLPPQGYLHISLPDLFSIPSHAAFISCTKRFSLYVFVANLYVLFMLSWWCISELILPSRKMKSFINFPLYSLEQNYTGFELVTQVVLK